MPDTQYNFAQALASNTHDRKLMLWMGMLEGITRTAERMTEEADAIDDPLTVDMVRNKLDILREVGEDLVEDFNLTEIFAEYGYGIDFNDIYPVLFRGNVKDFEWVNLSNIQVDSLPVNPSGLDTTDLVRGRVPVPPISLLRLGNGNFHIQDGRHRFLAFKLNGIDKIPAYINNGKQP